MLGADGQLNNRHCGSVSVLGYDAQQEARLGPSPRARPAARSGPGSLRGAHTADLSRGPGATWRSHIRFLEGNYAAEGNEVTEFVLWPSWDQPEINNREITGQSPHIWKLNRHF